MICPRTKGNCSCNSASDCILAPTPVERGDFNLFTSPPKPSLKYIERLVDKVELVCIEYGAKGVLTPPAEQAHQAKINAARAALLAAIRPLVEK